MPSATKRKRGVAVAPHPVTLASPSSSRHPHPNSTSLASPSSPQLVCWVELPPPRPRRKAEYICIDDLDLEDTPRPATKVKSSTSSSVCSSKTKIETSSRTASDDGGAQLDMAKRAPVQAFVEVQLDDHDDDVGPVRVLRPPNKSKDKGKGKGKEKSTAGQKEEKREMSRKRKEREEMEQGTKEKARKAKEKRRRRERRSHAGGSKESDDDDDDDDDPSKLKSYLNEDALARSTGSTHKAGFRKCLAKLRKERERARRSRSKLLRGSDSDDDDDDASSSRSDDDDDNGSSSDGSRHTSLFGSSVSGSDRGSRKKKKKTRKERRDGGATGVRSATPSEWSSEIEEISDSDSGDNSSSSGDDSVDFIVKDDHVETEEGVKMTSNGVSGPLTHASSSSPSGKRQHLLPNPSTSKNHAGSILSAFGLGHARLTLEDLCALWLEWAVVRMLIPFGNLSSSDRSRLERARAQLRSKIRSSEESLTSSAMRRQFSWYLREYPKLCVQLLFDNEARKVGGLQKRGCGACHRKSQTCSHFVRFEGNRYDQETLGRRETSQKKRRPSSSSSSSSSSSTTTISSSDSDDNNASDISSSGENLAESDLDDKQRPAKRFYVGGHCAIRARVLHALHHWEWTVMQGLNKHPAIRQVREDVKERGGYGLGGSKGPGADDVEFCLLQMSTGARGEEVRRLVGLLNRLVSDAEGVNRLQ